MNGATPLLLQDFMAWTGTTLTHDQTTASDWEDRQISDYSEGLWRHTDDQTTATDWEDTQMIRLQRGTMKTHRWSHHSEGLRRQADYQITARDYEDTQMIRLQRGIEKTRRWPEHSEGLRRHADDQTTARAELLHTRTSSPTSTVLRRRALYPLFITFRRGEVNTAIWNSHDNNPWVLFLQACAIVHGLPPFSWLNEPEITLR